CAAVSISSPRRSRIPSGESRSRGSMQQATSQSRRSRPILALTNERAHGVIGASSREARMDAQSLTEDRKTARRSRFARFVLILLGTVLALGAWQGFGVLMYGIEGSYDH